jgi:sucrose phosphorylase
MSLEGIPAFYIHNLLATPNGIKNVEKTGQNRSINRHKWDYQELEKLFSDRSSNQYVVLKELSKLIRIRRCNPAFHPNATQYTLHPLIEDSHRQIRDYDGRF